MMLLQKENKEGREEEKQRESITCNDTPEYFLGTLVSEVGIKRGYNSRMIFLILFFEYEIMYRLDFL